jgi:hypothetical protein
MLCEKCFGIVVLHAFSEGNCQECTTKIITPHIPCYKICKSCFTVVLLLVNKFKDLIKSNMIIF